MVIELVEMTISTKYSGFDKLNHRFSYLLDSLLATLGKNCDFSVESER